MNRVRAILVDDDPAAWERAGFALDGDGRTVRLGEAAIELAGGSDPDRDAGRGITGLRIEAPEPPTVERLDGLAVTWVTPDGDGDGEVSSATLDTHPNGATGVDHVVVTSPALERTVAAFEAAGMACRRVREAGTAERPVRQAFFRTGATILEVVSGAPIDPPPAVDDAPSRWFGLALDAEDLDRAAALLGDGIGPARAAVQPGRRIATVRHEALGVSVPLALMDHHRDRIEG